MATEPLSNEQTIEQALNNILGHTKDIANLMRAKEAAELAIRGGAAEKATTEVITDLIKKSGVTNQGFHGEKGLFKTYEDIAKKISGSFKSSQTVIKSYNTAVQQATNATKNLAKTTQAINYQYSIGRGKYVVPTPFQTQRSRVGGFADLLTGDTRRHRGLNRLKELSMDSTFDFNRVYKLLGKGKINPFQAAGLGLGRLASGAAFGGGAMGALAATGLGASAAIVGAIGAQVAKSVGDAIKTSLSSAALSMGMEARGATGWTTGNIASSIYGMRRMGLTTDAAMQALTQGQQLGLNQSQIRSAVAAQQALGLSNTLQKSQTLTRRMGWGNDPASYFRSLEPIAKKTGLSMEELSNATEEFASNLQGAMDPNMIRGLMSRYGDFIKTKAFSWADVANVATTTQRLEPNQQMAAAYFATLGGYKFKHTSLLGKAYELQRMGPNQLLDSMNAFRATVKGYMGGRSWSSFSDEEKYWRANILLRKQGLADFYKFPQGEELMSRIMSGGELTEKEKKAWKDASKSGTERIATEMEAIKNPLNQINTMLAGWFSEMGSAKVGAIAASIADSIVGKEEKPVNMNVTAVSTVKDVGIDFSIAGEPRLIYSGANSNGH